MSGEEIIRPRKKDEKKVVSSKEDLLRRVVSPTFLERRQEGLAALFFTPSCERRL